MKNLHSDVRIAHVNAVKGLLQTGRFANYTDEILDELLRGRALSDTKQYLGYSSGINYEQPPRANIFGLVASPCAGKSTTVGANQDMKHALVIDGSWLIGTASRQLLGNGENKKFQFPISYKHMTRIESYLS